MAVKCILTGQIPSVLDGVTENVQNQIDEKVDKVTGKGLSTEDYTTAEKIKLSGVEEEAQKNTVTSVAGKTGAVTLAASDVGLGNVNNTSDADKPISTATQAALDDKQDKIFEKVDGDIYNLDKDFILQHSESDLFVISGDVRTLFSVNSAIGVAANKVSLSTESGGFEVSYDGDTAKNTFEFFEALKITGIPTPSEDTDAANKAYADTKQPTITASGILQGDGAGNVTAAEEAEVSLVSLTVDMVEGAASPSCILNITLPAASWTGDGPYTQTVTISDGTANTKVDIMFDVDTYQQMVDDGIGFLAIDNDSGTFTAIAKGSQPSENLSIQVECKEVTLP